MAEISQEHRINHKGQVLSFIVFMTVWLADSFVLRYSTFLSHNIPLPVRLLSMVVVILFSIYLLKATMKAFKGQLNHHASHHDHDIDHLINSGPFRYVRNPLYLACLMVYIGLILWTYSLLSIVVFILIFIFYNYMASYEEGYLIAKFDMQYKSYKLKTGKWLPKLFK